MPTFGQDLIRSAHEALEIARGERQPAFVDRAGGDRRRRDQEAQAHVAGALRQDVRPCALRRAGLGAEAPLSGPHRPGAPRRDRPSPRSCAGRAREGVLIKADCWGGAHNCAKIYPRPLFPLPYCPHCLPVQRRAGLPPGRGRQQQGCRGHGFVNVRGRHRGSPDAVCTVRDDTIKSLRRAARGRTHAPARQGRAVVCAYAPLPLPGEVRPAAGEGNLMPHAAGGKPPRERLSMTFSTRARLSTLEC